jgi:hypothetical protein
MVTGRARRHGLPVGTGTATARAARVLNSSCAGCSRPSDGLTCLAGKVSHGNLKIAVYQVASRPVSGAW